MVYFNDRTTTTVWHTYVLVFSDGIYCLLSLAPLTSPSRCGKKESRCLVASCMVSIYLGNPAGKMEDVLCSVDTRDCKRILPIIADILVEAILPVGVKNLMPRKMNSTMRFIFPF